MRIGVDGRELVGQPTGVGRYLRHLCVEWAARPAAAPHEFVVYTPSASADPPLPSGPPGARVTQVVVPGPGDVWWEQTALARAAAADGLDVFFGPGYSLPLRLDIPAVVTLHDVSFAAHPEWFGWREGVRRRWLARRAAATARVVVTVSEFSRREIADHLDVDPARIRVVYNGVHRSPPGSGSRGSRAPLVLYVGARFNRRHLPTLLTAFARLGPRLPAAELAIVGPDRSHPAQDLRRLAAAAGLGARVVFHDYVDDDTLAALYARASVFAYLSEYEGFGMTPLEAVAAGVAPVVGDTPVAREVYGTAARFVPLHDPGAVADALAALLVDPAARDTLVIAGAAHVARYTWTRAADATLAVLETAARP